MSLKRLFLVVALALVLGRAQSLFSKPSRC
jgi:hypothetical protein